MLPRNIFSILQRSLGSRSSFNLNNTSKAVTAFKSHQVRHSHTNETTSHQPGPLPKTKEEGLEAAKKYNLTANNEETNADDGWHDQDFIGRDFIALTSADYKVIIDGAGADKSSEVESRIDQILNEYEYEKYSSNGRMPVTITIADMRELLLNEPFTSGQILKYLRFLFNREMARRRTKRMRVIKSEQRKQETANRYAQMDRQYSSNRSGITDSENGNIIYGLWHNSLFMRLALTFMRNNQSIHRLKQASMFNQKVVIDFSYDDFMSRHEMKNIADQIRLCYGLNRHDYTEPFDLWFCNYDDKKGLTAATLEGRVPNLHNNTMISITSKCYTEVFPKDRIIYLSPHAKQPLLSYNEDDIFVLGAMNDKTGPKTEISNVLAGHKGVRCCKLPLDNFISWQQGTKSLCLNHVLGIMLEHRVSGDWKKAFEMHIPKRKIKTIETVLEEDEKRRQKLRSSDRHKASHNILKSFNKSFRK